MTLPESSYRQICENIITKFSIFPEEKLCRCHITPVPDDNGDTSLQIDTEKDRYKLTMTVSTNLKDSERVSGDSTKYPETVIEEENLLVKIKSLSVEGYNSCTLEKVSDDVGLIRPILEALAYNHSKSVDLNACRIINDNYRYSLIRKDFKKILSILYEVIEKKGGEEIDGALFRRGVEKLYYSSVDALKPHRQNVYVESCVLRSKLFFGFTGSSSVNCKIINVVPNKYLPLVYDVLLCVFLFSTQKVRQHYFHDLLDYYYDALMENLLLIGLNVLDILPYEEYQKLIKKFSSYVKVEVALRSCQQYLKPLKVLEDNSFVSNVWNLFDSNTGCFEFVMKWIVEIYEIVLYTNLSREDCYKIVKNKVGLNNYEFSSWRLSPMELRSGFLGDYYKLTIDVKENDELQSSNFFLKYLATYNESFQEMSIFAFKKEEFFYGTFIPEVNKLGLQEITDFLPKCYFSRSDDVIVFEDLSSLDYKSLEKGEALSYENLVLVTKQLAKLHACSLLYEEIMTEKLGKPCRIGDEFAKYVEEAFLIRIDGRPPSMIASGISGNLNYLLDVFPDIPKKFTLEEFKKKLKELYDKMMLCDLKSTKFRNVLAHGDLWGNNFLFKKDENHKPVECCLIDYQLIRYCPPGHDLLFFLYVNSDKDTRKKYMFKILEDYYNELSQIFKKYNFDFTEIYTYNAFLESCEFVKPEAIALASLYLQFVLYPAEKVEELALDKEKFQYIVLVDRKEVIDEVYHNNVYRQRIREIVEDLYEVC